ncbi:hypothetical protein [Megalodesulfovibrio paquesii]
MHRVVAFCVLLVALLLFAMSLHASTQGSAQDAGALTVAKCAGACHDPRRICFRLGKVEPSFWPATVAKMQQKGAKIDETQARAIAGWLTTSGPSAKPLCP